MVSITWRNKLRISVKYLKQLFLTPRFHKCLKSCKQVGKNGSQVWLCFL